MHAILSAPTFEPSLVIAFSLRDVSQLALNHWLPFNFEIKIFLAAEPTSTV